LTAVTTRPLLEAWEATTHSPQTCIVVVVSLVRAGVARETDNNTTRRGGIERRKVAAVRDQRLVGGGDARDWALCKSLKRDWRN